ncbi:hypothetical protein B484DRAFT_390294, partial [Ochromonadaceae sp. CCMP2298]
MLQETISARQARSGISHPDTLRSTNNLASLYVKSGRMQAGLEEAAEGLGGGQGGHRVLQQLCANRATVMAEMQVREVVESSLRIGNGEFRGGGE